MSFWNNPENNSVKMLIVVVTLAAIGAFVFYSQNTSEETTGRVISVPSTTAVGSTPTTGTTAAEAPLEGSACTHTGTSGSGEIAGGECCFPSPQPSSGYTNCFTSPNSKNAATINASINFTGPAGPIPPRMNTASGKSPAVKSSGSATQ